MKLRFAFFAVGILTAGVNSDRAALANELPTTTSQSKPKIRIQPTRQPLSTTTTTTTSSTSDIMTSLQGGGINNNNNNNKECDERFPFLETLRRNYSHQPVFLQAVEEMAINLEPLFADPTDGEFYQRAFLVMTEPERTISFRVPWEDDEGNMRYNRGWRVEFNR